MTWAGRVELPSSCKKLSARLRMAHGLLCRMCSCFTADAVGKGDIAKARVRVEFTKSVKELIPMQTIPTTLNLA